MVPGMWHTQEVGMLGSRPPSLSLLVFPPQPFQPSSAVGGTAIILTVQIILGEKKN